MLPSFPETPCHPAASAAVICELLSHFKPKSLLRCCPCAQIGSAFRGTFELDAAPFNWGKDYQRPNLAPEDIVVYEMGVRSFTADSSSKLASGQEGTFAGLMAKVGFSYLSAVRLSDYHRMGSGIVPSCQLERETSAANRRQICFVGQGQSLLRCILYPDQSC